MAEEAEGSGPVGEVGEERGKDKDEGGKGEVTVAYQYAEGLENRRAVRRGWSGAELRHFQKVALEPASLLVFKKCQVYALWEVVRWAGCHCQFPTVSGAVTQWGFPH